MAGRQRREGDALRRPLDDEASLGDRRHGRDRDVQHRVGRDRSARPGRREGGRVEPCTLTDREREIVHAIAPRLVADGLFFVGLDLVGEKLTEVNVTSPTGIQELSAHLGRDVAQEVIQWAVDRVHAKRF